MKPRFGQKSSKKFCFMFTFGDRLDSSGINIAHAHALRLWLAVRARRVSQSIAWMRSCWGKKKTKRPFTRCSERLARVVSRPRPSPRRQQEVLERPKTCASRRQTCRTGKFVARGPALNFRFAKCVTFCEHISQSQAAFLGSELFPHMWPHVARCDVLIGSPEKKKTPKIPVGSRPRMFLRHRQ